MISVQNYPVTAGLFYYVTVGGTAKTRMREINCVDLHEDW